MKLATSFAAVALVLSAGSAGGQSFDGKTTDICLDVSGRTIPVTCRAPASRLDNRYDICTCPMGGQQVTAAVCPAGVRPPAESAAFARARHAAIARGSIVGATFEGAPMCVEGRNARPGS